MKTNNRERLLFKTLIGSRAYNCAVESSDFDYKGVYIQHPDDILSFKYKEQKDVTKDEVYYEIKRFIELLSSANPTMVELLYMPNDCIQYMHPAFQLVLNERDKFLTKECKNSFAGYAIQQIKKARGLDKKMNWEKNRVQKKGLIDFCYAYEDGRSTPLKKYLEHHNLEASNCGLVNIPHFRDSYNLFYSDNPELKFRGVEGKNYSLKLSSVPKGMKPEVLVHYNKDGFMQHTKDYKSYETWLKERNTQRYVDVKNHGQKIDGKNMMHCTRLIEEALEIANQGTINIRRPNADYLISIRKGEVDLEEILNNAEKGIKQIEEAFKSCDLPKTVDEEFKNELLINVRKEIQWN